MGQCFSTYDSLCLQTNQSERTRATTKRHQFAPTTPLLSVETVAAMLAVLGFSQVVKNEVRRKTAVSVILVSTFLSPQRTLMLTVLKILVQWAKLGQYCHLVVILCFRRKSGTGCPCGICLAMWWGYSTGLWQCKPKQKSNIGGVVTFIQCQMCREIYTISVNISFSNIDIGNRYWPKLSNWSIPNLRLCWTCKC